MIHNKEGEEKNTIQFWLFRNKKKSINNQYTNVVVYRRILCFSFPTDNNNDLEECFVLITMISTHTEGEYYCDGRGKQNLLRRKIELTFQWLEMRIF